MFTFPYWLFIGRNKQKKTANSADLTPNAPKQGAMAATTPAARDGMAPVMGHSSVDNVSLQQVAAPAAAIAASARQQQADSPMAADLGSPPPTSEHLERSIDEALQRIKKVGEQNSKQLIMAASGPKTDQQGMASDRHLTDLVDDIKSCRHCLLEPRAKPLPHEPRPVLVPSLNAKICIIGQAPGTRVHASGKPFTDPSGDRLRDWMGVTSEQFYDANKVAIVPMGFCFPGLDDKGSDLPPRKECAPKWQEQLFDLMPQIELKLLVGMYAQSWHLGKNRHKTLTQTVAHWHDYVSDADGLSNKPMLLPMPHPSWRNTAWLRKNPFFEQEVIPFLRREIKRLIAAS